MKWRKLNIEDVKADEFYNMNEIALMLGVHLSTIIRRHKRGELKATNIGTDKKATYRVLGKDLLYYLK